MLVWIFVWDLARGNFSCGINRDDFGSQTPFASWSMSIPHAASLSLERWAAPDFETAFQGTNMVRFYMVRPWSTIGF
ncbi:hypothetical protein MSP8887_04327 [Marinomonas spartinae]|nr:hypothetical protein MSP8887_04327 [Marinomonas spartinae]